MRYIDKMDDFYSSYLYIRACVEADGEGTAEVPVYQKGKEELVPNRPDRQVQKVEVTAQRRVGDRE